MSILHTASLNKGRIGVLSFAHLLNDWYMNYIQALLPFMVAVGLGVSKGAFLISAFTITSSLLQPFFGYLVDKKNQRWMVYVGTIWMAVLICLIGVFKSYPLLVLIAVLAGLGTAAFHPQASAMVAAVSGERKGFFQAIFIAAGNVGWALTPLMVIPFTQQYGLELTPVFIIPGIIVGTLLWFTTPKVAITVKAAQPPNLSALSSCWYELTKIVLVVACRSLAYFGLIAFLPLYLQNNNTSLLVASRLLFIMLFAGAMGGLIGGHLSDLFGRKTVIVGSLIVASPLFYLFNNASGLVSYLLLAVAGAALLASSSVTVVAAQEVISKNAAMAAGLMLGFGIGIGGLGIGIVGVIAENMGLDYVINILFWLPTIAGILALSLKGKKMPASVTS